MPKRNLVPIQVVLEARPNGHLDWPDFGRLPTDVRGGLEWSRFVDRHGIGWHYDKVENIGRGNAEVDRACTCVPADFAYAAAAAFPNVTILDEAAFERFWDERAYVHEPAEVVDVDVLQEIDLRVRLERQGLLPPPSAEVASDRTRALDPDDDQRGIRRNRRKRWTDAKAQMGLTIHPQRARTKSTP